jgi:tRNA (guanine-N7-)-methyltransferase
VQERTIADLARILRSGAEFRFVTDVPDYAAWTLARFMRSEDFSWTAERADDWRRPWPGFVATRYEAKAVRQGRVPTYLVFRREDAAAGGAPGAPPAAPA